MNGSGDKMVTTREPDPLSAQKSTGQQKARKGKPAALVKFGSAVVPVYRTTSGNRVRFMISYHRDGKRLRQIFASLDTAKKEALLVAQRIQAGMQHVTDMKPHDRDAYVTAKEMLANLGIPLVAAVEDYVRSLHRRWADNDGTNLAGSRNVPVSHARCERAEVRFTSRMHPWHFRGAEGV